MIISSAAAPVLPIVIVVPVVVKNQLSLKKEARNNRHSRGNLVVSVVCHFVTSAVAPVLSVVIVVPVVVKKYNQLS